jgi:hypothetical protein
MSGGFERRKHTVPLGNRRPVGMGDVLLDAARVHMFALRELFLPAEQRPQGDHRRVPGAKPRDAAGVAGQWMADRRIGNEKTVSSMRWFDDCFVLRMDEGRAGGRLPAVSAPGRFRQDCPRRRMSAYRRMIRIPGSLLMRQQHPRNPGGVGPAAGRGSCRLCRHGQRLLA